MEISGLLEDAELHRIPDGLTFQTQAGKDSYFSMLQRISTNIPLLQKKAAFIYALRIHGDKSIAKSFQRLCILENDIQPEKASSENVKDAVEGQIYFTSEYLSFINTIPWVIRIFTFLKIYIAPISALFVPLIMMIMPYFMLHYMFHVPVSWEEYQVLMKRLILGISPNEPWTLKHIVQAIWTVGSIGQSMFQPFFHAYHTYKLNKVYVHKGKALQEYVSILSDLISKVESVGGRKIYVPPMSSDVYVVASLLEHQPKLVQYYTRIAGSLEVYWAISQNPRWTPVAWHGDKIGLRVQEFSDICINPANAVMSNLSLSGHGILTGPNRGGKSSNLRGILQAVIFGQVFGMAPVKYISYRPYDWIYTRLKTKDSPGKQSLFEKEVHAVSKILQLAKDSQRNGFVLIDELFHSTNPPDAEISAKVFLSQFWNHGNINSIVSTHIFSLVKESPSNIKFLCCQAKESSSGQIVYSYRLSPGICTLSSVKEVLREARVLR